MKITIHRGINQIGGCITEIATANKRILIDLGQNLPDNKGIVEDNLANSPAIETLTNGIDAIFYTHYHGDHIGLFHYVPDAIPQYIGATAKQVAICKHKQLSRIHGREELSERELSKLEKMRTFVPAQQITDIEGFTITPFFVSHSACDSFMFLIEAEGKRILHTGDFRDHGYLGKGLLPTMEKYIIKEKVDILISEGTMLSRLDERVQHEKELRKKVIEVMKRYKNVFVMCSSTDLERLATFHSAHNHFEKRPFVCDSFQQDVLKIFTETAGTKTDLFDFGKTYSFFPKNKKLVAWMKEQGFCMLVRATKKFDKWLDALLPQLDSQETVLIYSMWPEYVNPDNAKHVKDDYLKFIGRFPAIEKIHTSGHASAEALAEVCNLVNPTTAIIPIHSEHANHFGKLDISEELKSKIITESTVMQDIEIKINTTKYENDGKELAEEFEKKRKDNFKRRMNFFCNTQESMSIEKTIDYTDKIKSVLFGVAVSDALGVPVEFKSRQEMRQNPISDMIGYGTYNQPPGTWSDDSSLTFCLVEALTQDFDLNKIGQNFVKWYQEGYWTPYGEVFDIGNSTRDAIYRISNGTKPELAGSCEEIDNGNGSLMRIAPLLFYLLDKTTDERFEITRQVSSSTHRHIRSVIACFYYLEFARQLFEGKNKWLIYKNLQAEITDYLISISINPKEIALFDRLLKGNIHELPENEISSSGYVLHTLEASIWCLLTTGNYKESVLKAVNLGEDTDTTGAVTGGLAGLLYGFENIPQHWIKQLARKDDIVDLAKRVVTFLQHYPHPVQ